MGRQGRSLRDRTIALRIEVAIAWRDYLDLTRSLMGVFYEQAEELEWEKLQKRLRAINRKFQTALAETEALRQERLQR